MKARRRRSATRVARSGLAPLELVLYLPLMLLVMALMILFGVAASWKLRTLATSRHAAFRAVDPRSGAADPFPRGWPSTAEMAKRSGTPSLFPIDPFGSHAVVRGPVVSDPATGNFLRVRDERLDMHEGLTAGFAHLQRPFPILAKMPPHGIDFARDTLVLGGSRWNYPAMGIGSNISRRIPALYEFDLQQHVPHLTDEFVQAALDIINNPNRPALRPLEGGDPEVRALIGETSPDFQPKLTIGAEMATIAALRPRWLRPAYCELDGQRIRIEKLGPELLDRLRGRGVPSLPERMTVYYLNTYQEALSGFQDRIDELNAMTPPPADLAQQIAGLQQQIGSLQMKITQLQQFQSQL